jgi:hypothetical protein
MTLGGHGFTTRVFPEDPAVGAALVPSAVNDAGGGAVAKERRLGANGLAR